MSNDTQDKAGLVDFMPGLTRYPEPKWYLGLDLGQRHDHSALAAIELIWIFRGICRVTYVHHYQPEAVIRSLTRFPLGTCYDELQKIVESRLDNLPPSKKELIIDAGGPGPPVVDRLRKTLPGNVKILPVIITGGKGINTLTGGYTGIPRRTLITTLLLAMGTGSLVCEEATENFVKFEDELVELRGDNTHPGTSRAHDDLVMAVSLALSSATRDVPDLLPQPPGGEKKRSKFGYSDKPLF